MGKGIHNIKGKDAVKAFVKFGGVERKGEGDHIKLRCRMD